MGRQEPGVRRDLRNDDDLAVEGAGRCVFVDGRKLAERNSPGHVDGELAAVDSVDESGQLHTVAVGIQIDAAHS